MKLLEKSNYFSVSSRNSSNSLIACFLFSILLFTLTTVYPYFLNDVITDEEIVTLFLNNVDKCLGHEAFTAGQKQRLIQFKSKIEVKYYDLELKYGPGFLKTSKA